VSIDFEISNEILAELGKTIVLHSDIDRSVTHFAGVFLGTDKERADIATSEISFKNKLAILSSLVTRLFSRHRELCERFTRVRKELEEFEDFRNRVAHSYWDTSESNEPHIAIREKVTAKLRKGLVYEKERVSVSDISAALDAALLAQQELHSVCFELYKIYNPMWQEFVEDDGQKSA
jgi:hypothetical protein